MFFQNVFDQEFRGNWVLGDRQYVVEFRVPANTNKSDCMMAWNEGPYDMTIDGGNLTINYAWDIDFKNYSPLVIDVTGVVPAATTAQEVVTKLNANSIFAELFVAQLTPNPLLTNNVGFDPPMSVLITANRNRPKKNVRVWINNDGAEAALRFNKKAGVAELPLYFERHTIAERFNFPDSVGMLVLLDEADPIDQTIIEEAGFDPGAMLEDWQLLRGRSGLFNFQKLTIDGSDRITEIIEYPAGAQVGDFARRIRYTYSGANKNPDQITEEPYTLASGDLVTP